MEDLRVSGEQLTQRQFEVLNFIRHLIRSRGYGPTVREIGTHFRIRSPNGVMCHLRALEKKVGRSVQRDDVLSYLLYPEVFLKYMKFRHAFSDVSVLPTPQFFYGLRWGEEITVEIEPGKTLVVKFLTVGEPHPDGQRTVFFELNGQPREIVVRDKSLRVAAPAHPKVNPSEPGHVGSPSPGVITSVFVQLSHKVGRGDKLLMLEAMKMQSTIYAPVAGRISQLLVEPGQRVEAKDLLLVIEGTGE